MEILSVVNAWISFHEFSFMAEPKPTSRTETIKDMLTSAGRTFVFRVKYSQFIYSQAYFWGWVWLAGLDDLPDKFWAEAQAVLWPTDDPSEPLSNGCFLFKLSLLLSVPSHVVRSNLLR